MLGGDGSVLWFCPRRFDEPSVFGRLLDDDAGHWSIRPAGEATRIERRYVDDFPVLETTFHAPAGELRLTDALAMASGSQGHGIGGTEVTHLVRLAQCVEGDVEVVVELRPRAEYGLTHPHVVESGGGWELSGGRTRLRLLTTAAMRPQGDGLAARLTLRHGESASWILAAGDHDGRTAEEALADTLRAWRSWAEPHGKLPGPYGDAARRSAIVLQALTYAPSGVVIAAPTTSLPERTGKGWNWDYRYAWLRDLSFVVRALWNAACPNEPRRYLDWISRSLGRLDGDHVQIMFGVEGERDLTEHELAHLSGFRGEQPVRVGNDAWKQRQLDVLGEVLDSALLMRDHLGDAVPRSLRDTLVGLADRAARGWQEPDFGMWEARDRARHYLSSKVMCWVALDRAIGLADALGADNRVATWARERDRVRRAILNEGWNADVRAYTGAIGSDHLDASVLLMPLVGIIDGGDPRMVATVRSIEEQLATERGVQRWSGEDSGFVLCGFWLSECLALAGDREGARQRFDATAAVANDLGLMPEAADLETAEALGNMPLALSHVGLINAAWRLNDAEGGTEGASGDTKKGRDIQ